MKNTSIWIALSSLAIATPATATTLYNGTGLPELQGFLAPGAISAGGLPINPTPFQSVDSITGTFSFGSVGIDTTIGATNTNGYFGYSNYLPNLLGDLDLVNTAFPSLDADNGYSVFFDLSLDAVVDSDDNRGAFSLLAVSSDGTRAIELDFDDNRVFAQSDTLNGGFSEFLRAETSSFIDTSNTNSYELRVNSTGYELLANNTSILTGDLRSYQFDNSSSDPNIPFDPYTAPNFIFLGDLTDQASGTFTLGEVSIGNNTSNTTTPEPTSLLALGMLGLGLIKLRR